MLPTTITTSPSASTTSALNTTTDCIRLRGARVHNLKNVSVDIPRDQLVVITGVSGSGKSSLAFDTLFAEGQRRYLDSLSPYTRQFLDQMERPDLDELDGLPPTLSIEQRTGSIQRRSTLATVTEIYDYLRLLFARAGTAHCPKCGDPVQQQSAAAVVEQILQLEQGRKVMILAPLVRARKGTHRDVFERVLKEGFVRARADGVLVDAASPPELAKSKPHDIEVVIDRVVIKEGLRSRLDESVTLALKHGDGTCIVCDETPTGWRDRLYSSKLACARCSIGLPTLDPRHFSFNSPAGACPCCDGLGEVLAETSETADTTRQDEDDPPPMKLCPECSGARLNEIAAAVTFAGLSLPQLTSMTVADASPLVDRWLTQLNPLAAAQSPDTVNTDTVTATATANSAADAADAGVATGLIFDTATRLVAEKSLPAVARRLQFLLQVGLGYLTLDRRANTLSGGEFQRSRLAGCLGMGVTGVCYVLDEPTIGLHPRDTQQLLDALMDLKQQGNTVLLVEHELDIIAAADYILDLGPGAGIHGGELLAAGTPQQLANYSHSVTGCYLKQRTKTAPIPSPRDCQNSPLLSLRNIHRHNLAGLNLDIPLTRLVCLTGVSGSGKSTLVFEALVPLLRQQLSLRQSSGRSRPIGIESRATRSPAETLPVGSLAGAEALERLVVVDQSPLGKSGRSNPATAAGLWDEIRKVFAATRDARLRGYSASRFSFNARGGRCEECSGQGSQRIEMKYLADLEVICPTCGGSRFNRQTLQIRYRDLSIADVLALRFDAATRFFENFTSLRDRLQVFVDVGLGYLTLGQSARTLSGGEAQRIRLATELGKTGGGNALFILDEPTTGLHPADIDRLMFVLQRLVDAGHSLLVIEHQQEVIARSDWVIDLGPEAGMAGGQLVGCGPPKQLAHHPHSHTATALRRWLASN